MSPEMKPEAGRKKKSLLLLTNHFLFNIAKSILEKMGYEVTDQIDASDYDFVVVDEFVMQSGIAGLVKEESSDKTAFMPSVEEPEPSGRARIVQRARRIHRGFAPAAQFN